MKMPKQIGMLSRQDFAYALIVVFFVMYLFSGFWFFGLLVGLSLLWAVALEFWLGAKEHGLRKEIWETALALLLALAVWFGSGFLLQTPSPLNAIVSCSMLPHIQRGDMVVLRGDRIQAPTADIPSLEGVSGARIYENGEEGITVNGSLYSYCVQGGKGSELCKRFVAAPAGFSEKHGEITIGYEKCGMVYQNSAKQYGPCVSWLEAKGVRYYENLSNDVVVYQPNPGEYYARVGDIIHRAFIKLLAQDTGRTYFLTKGDNNPVFDIQVYDEKTGAGNNPVEVERSKGRILFSVPYIGYLKLFISPAGIMTPDGCDRIFEKYAG